MSLDEQRPLSEFFERGSNELLHRDLIARQLVGGRDASLERFGDGALFTLSIQLHQHLSFQFGDLDALVPACRDGAIVPRLCSGQETGQWFVAWRPSDTRRMKRSVEESCAEQCV